MEIDVSYGITVLAETPLLESNSRRKRERERRLTLIRASEFKGGVRSRKLFRVRSAQCYGAINASVVSKSPATEAAFCSASRTTAVGSRMPASIMST